MDSYLLDDEEEEEEIIRDDLINPYWLEDKELKNGKEGKISTDESLFWKDMIDKVSCFGQHFLSMNCIIVSNSFVQMSNQIPKSRTFQNMSKILRIVLGVVRKTSDFSC